jgi:hypothetical protein
MEAKPVLQRLDFTINGTLITPSVCIEIPRDNSNAALNLQRIVLGIHNPDDTIAAGRESSLGLILPQDFPPVHYSSGVRLRDKRFLYELGTIGRLLPGQWDTVQVDLPIHAIASRMGKEIDAELRIFTRSGPLSTAFFLKFV